MRECMSPISPNAKRFKFKKEKKNCSVFPTDRLGQGGQRLHQHSSYHIQGAVQLNVQCHFRNKNKNEISVSATLSITAFEPFIIG